MLKMCPKKWLSNLHSETLCYYFDLWKLVQLEGWEVCKDVSMVMMVLQFVAKRIVTVSFYFRLRYSSSGPENAFFHYYFTLMKYFLFI